MKACIQKDDVEEDREAPPCSSSSKVYPPPSSSSSVTRTAALSSAPVNPFSRLSASTNLNPPPSNWLLPHPTGADHLSGFRPAPPPCQHGFPSLLMASRFVEFVRQVDVMASSENIKKLLKLAYSNAPVSLVVHRVGKTLLIDDFDIHGFLLRTSEKEWKWFKRWLMETVLTSQEERNKAMVRRSKTANAISRRNLVSKFLYRSLQQGDVVDAVAEGEQGPNDLCSEKDPTGELDQLDLNPSIPLLPKPSVESSMPGQKASVHEFARNLLWNFEDIRMLIGSDMPIFGDAEHPSVSLRLHDADKPINVLTGLDYWLDNLMCQVPEVLMCYHLDGIVQNYELIKTEELPNMEGCKFSPRVVRDVAKNILSFLKSNAAKEGHTYWLFKGKGDDVVKLYDLTSLCSSHGSNSGEDGSKASKQEREEDFHNPFRTAVSMLLYNVASNILKNKEERHRGAKTARQLLDKCLFLLDQDKFPHIATSAHFMLSDLYVPDDIDPSNPNFRGEGDRSPQESSLVGDDEDGGGDREEQGTKEIDMTALRLPAPASIDDAASQHQSSSSAALAMDTKERCSFALSHIVMGLRRLQFLARRREEDEEAERKRREKEERENMKMAHPSEPIPMGYDDPDRKQVDVYISKEEGGALSTTLDQAAPSWHDHLKRVLLRKAFLVYITLGEISFSENSFGSALRCIKRALNCNSMVEAICEQGDSEQGSGQAANSDAVLSFAFGVAGDCYKNMLRNWDEELVEYQEQYNKFASEDDAELVEQVEHHVDENKRDSSIKFPRDIEEAMALSRSCLQRAIRLMGSQESAEKASLTRRFGDVCNELGSFYINQMAQIVQQTDDDGEGQVGLEPLQHMGEEVKAVLQDALESFQAVGDDTNSALVLSNTGRLLRIRAYGHRLSNEAGQMSKEERLLHMDALSQYKLGLVTLKSRHKSPDVWDAINWEYSTSLYNFASQLQDGGISDDSLTTEDLQRLVTEQMDRTLKSCAVDQEGPRQCQYQYRAATVHLRLGTMHQKLFLLAPPSDGVRRVHLRRLAEHNYEKAARLFSELEANEDLIRSQMYRLSLLEFGPDNQGAKSRTKFFTMAFGLLLECKPALAGLAREEHTAGGQGETDKCERLKLVDLVLKRTQENLLALYTFLKKSGDGGNGKQSQKEVQRQDSIKDLYAQSLKVDSSSAEYLINLVSLLETASIKVKKSLK